MSDLLNRADATIVGGPDSAGVYRVLVADGANAETSLELFAKSEVVRFFAETQ